MPIPFSQPINALMRRNRSNSANELYDNALKAIREKRAELQKLKEMKKAKEKIVLEFAKSPDDVDMVSIVEDIVQHSQQGATYDKECGKDYKRRPFIYLFQESDSLSLKSDNSCARSREYLPLGEEYTENATEQEPRTSELGGKANEGILTFRRKEVTVDEIANAIVQIENDFFEKYDSSFTISKEALVNVVAKVQRYIIDQLKIGPVDFVSVRLPRSSTRMILKKNRRSRISGKLRKIRHERPIRIQNRRGGRDKNISLKERENGILIYDGKEVTAQVIVRAIAKLIRAIYGRKPPFRISRSALTEVICDKQERVLKVLKQSVPHPNLPENKGTAFAGTRLPLLDNSANEFGGGGTPEIVGKSTKKIRRKIKPVFIRRKLSESEKCPKKKKARKKKPKSKMKEVSPASRGEPIKGRFVDLDEVTPTRRSLVAAEDHTESEENQSDKEPKPSERGRQDKTATYEEEESSPKLKLRKPEGSDSSAESKATHGKTTWSYLHRRSVLRSRTERQIYNSSRYRGRIHRIFATGVTSPRNDKRTSPKKKPADQGSIEEKNSSSTKIEAAPTVVVAPPPRVDYSSIHGRMTAAPTNLIIRTVEKKSKKRTKKGWRKSWI
ncbi:unnamed protein product [Nippostrongylus brasiliensis]|uniref:Uncharacterized protein n=1 Tax=Nippostrongylus brasiliensis TaxID=27835 RepID=A0A0N4YJD9_NIPBR|nr:unnamed protein product [Nippostrongylus brasiliensis]